MCIGQKMKRIGATMATVFDGIRAVVAPETGDIALWGPIVLIALGVVILLIFGIRFFKSRK